MTTWPALKAKGAASLTFTVPLPPAELSPNGGRGEHWATHSKPAKKYRFDCYYMLLGSLNRSGLEAPRIDPAVLSLRLVYCYGRRQRDIDNAIAMLKPAIDSLKDAGIIVNDSPRHLSYGTVESTHCKRACRCGGRVEIEIAEEEP